MVTQRIAEILRNGQPDESVTIKGWVRTKRELKGFAFIEVNDGSFLANLQAVLNTDLPDYEEVIKQLNTGASVEVTGVLVASQGKGQRIELKVSSMKVYGEADPETYPLQKKRHSLNFCGRLGICDRVPILLVLSSESAMPVQMPSINFFKNEISCGFIPR
jgi:asparaginyl-tRNA synthetase